MTSQPLPTAGADSDRALAEFVRAERVRFVFIQSAVPIFFSPVAACILSLALWRAVDHTLLLSWTAGLFAIAVLRVAMIRAYPRGEPTAEQVRHWERIFVASILLVDLWWGVGGLFLLVPSFPERALVFSFMMLMASGHSASYAAHPATVTLGVLALTIPITIAFSLQPDTYHRVMAVAAVLYLLALFRSIRTLGYFFGHAHRLAHELEKERDRVARLARSDFLTSLNNRRAFFESGSEALRQPSALLMLDIDHFKDVNDLHGHAAGDAVIRVTADAIRRHLREGDLAGRMGGEEFAVLLPETTLEEAFRLAERLRSGIEREEVEHEGQLLRFTVSAGVSALQADETLEHLIARADAALYDAKHEGRNRVVTA